MLSVNLMCKDVWAMDEKDRAFYSSAMIAAAGGNNVEVVKIFLASGLDVDSRNEVGDTALIEAADHGATDTLKFLLEKGADLNAKNDEGWTPLISAAYMGHKDIANLLIEKGADVNMRGVGGNTALMSAVANAKFEIVRLLVDKVKNPDVNVRNDKGETLLMMAVERCDCEIVNVLIDHGANIKGSAGKNLLSLAEVWCQPGFKNCLVQKGVDVDSQLFAAVRKNSTADAKMLLEIGANINVRDDKGWSPLMLAAYGDCREMLSLLIDKGADLDAVNGQNMNALNIALSSGNREIVSAIQCAERRKKFFAAVQAGNGQEVAAMLAAQVDAGTKNQALLIAAERGLDGIIDSLLRNGADVNFKDHSGNTALMVAVRSFEGHAMVDLLIKRGGDVNAKNNAGETAAYLVIPYCDDPRYLEILKLLMEKGSDINAKNDGGDSPLLKSVGEIGGSRAAAEVLIAKGADMNARNSYGWTPLMAAAHSPYADYSAVARLLIDKGADVNARDEFGRTALSIARGQKHIQIQEMLEKAGAK
jgi:cytohesin